MEAYRHRINTEYFEEGVFVNNKLLLKWKVWITMEMNKRILAFLYHSSL
jgi:hypothetical protein